MLLSKTSLEILYLGDGMIKFGAGVRLIEAYDFASQNNLMFPGKSISIFDFTNHDRGYMPKCRDKRICFRRWIWLLG